jgi:hypothetical protein
MTHDAWRERRLPLGNIVKHGRRATVSFVVVVAACSSPQKDISDLATSPLNDLNIVHAKIPRVLNQARRQPYVVPADQSCEALAADIRALDEVLGPDLDMPLSADDPDLLERGTTAVSGEAMSMLQGSAEDVVPFRHWVRKLSGAERYSKKVQAAIVGGTVRRSFLKGIRFARGCGAGTLSPVVRDGVGKQKESE